MRNFLFLLLLLQGTWISAQPFKVSGQVFCEGSDLVIDSAMVLLKGSNGSLKECIADDKGYFEFMCDTFMYALKAKSNKTITNQLGTKMQQYYSSNVDIFDFSKKGKDTIVNVSLEVLHIGCGNPSRYIFQVNKDSLMTYSPQPIDLIYFIRENSIETLTLTGYSLPNEPEILRQKRAQTIKNEFVKLGLEADKILIDNSLPNRAIIYPRWDCYGNFETEPIDSPANARVEISHVTFKRSPEIGTE